MIDKLTQFLKPFVNKRVSEDFLTSMDRNIKTIAGVDITLPDTKGYLQVFVFRVKDVYEMLSVLAVMIFLSVVFIMLGVLRGMAANGIVMAIALIALTLSGYTGKLKKFKDQFQRELPDVIDAMLQGLKVGTPVESVLDYVSKSKKSIVTPFLKEIVMRINAGESLRDALDNVSPKTLSPDFHRIARILSMRSQTTTDIVSSLERLQENMELELETKIISMAENAPIKYTLHIFVGYVIPFILVIVYPLILMIFKFMGQVS